MARSQPSPAADPGSARDLPAARRGRRAGGRGGPRSRRRPGDRRCRRRRPRPRGGRERQRRRRRGHRRGRALAGTAGHPRQQRRCGRRRPPAARHAAPGGPARRAGRGSRCRRPSKRSCGSPTTSGANCSRCTSTARSTGRARPRASWRHAGTARSSTWHRSAASRDAPATALLRGQGRHHRLHALGREGAHRPGRPCERARAGPRRHAAGCAASSTPAGARSPRARPPADSPRPRRSPRRSPSWSPTTPPTSSARR